MLSFGSVQAVTNAIAQSTSHATSPSANVGNVPAIPIKLRKWDYKIWHLPGEDQTTTAARSWRSLLAAPTAELVGREASVPQS